MMIFHFQLKRISEPKHARPKFDLEKMKDPSVLETFQALIGGKFASLTIMNNEDTDIDSVRFLANIIRRKTPGSVQKFLICATKGEN